MYGLAVVGALEGHDEVRVVGVAAVQHPVGAGVGAEVEHDLGVVALMGVHVGGERLVEALVARARPRDGV